MTVCIDTLDFEEGAGHHAHGAPSSMAPASPVALDGRPDQLARLVEAHKPWAERVARELLARIGGAFELGAMRTVLQARFDIQGVIGAHGITAYGALEQLILDCARALSPKGAEA